MPTELTPPFDTTARDPRDEQLVGEVLGKTAAGEMTELAGSDTSQPETIPANLEVTKNEQTATKDAEKNPAERRREQYHIWAVKHGKDEEWVDRKFIFEKNGQVRVDETLRLHEMGISEFPPGLYRVNGNLTAGNNEFTEIKNVPEGVMELFLNNNRISVIENIPETVKKLVLCHNRISVIQNIPASVNDLDLDNNPTES